MITLQRWHRAAVLALQAYYWAPGGPSGFTRSELTERIRGNWKPALADYYARFAYERAGADPTWAACARELLMDWTRDAPGDDLPQWAWRELERRLGKTNGLNPHNNGLYPYQPGRPPMTRFAASLPAEDCFNIFAWEPVAECRSRG